ncbi:MAG: acyl carrier protein [Bacilli bacterium]|nr:acyl carrier protein [Bacilli bacterium]
MLEKLKELMRGVNSDIDLDNVTLDTKLIDDLHFDSLGMMMFAMAIEDEFGISFDEPMNFVTVKDVVDFIESQKK